MAQDLSQYNLKNSAVKRILQEVKELRKEASKDFIGEPVQDNIFEWHFAIRGPEDTEFEGGIFHGRILLPPDYPFKPPTFMMLSVGPFSPCPPSESSRGGCCALGRAPTSYLLRVPGPWLEVLTGPARLAGPAAERAL
mmetsp:Transcript_8885/g.29385  ORF Transcript_8885/g.29385 Transcript_8885/m.29385 type:complete len:138 (-) Transcript_8885:354-767(-)